MAKKQKKSSSTSKKIEKKIMKEARKNPKGFFLALSLVLVLALVLGGVYLYLRSSGKLPSSGGDSSSFHSEEAGSDSVPESLSYAEGECDPISFHFIERGEPYSGDAVYIKAGENDILIDAGAKKGSAIAIENYLDDATRGGDYVQDGTLEYVFSTHGHQDHIAGMMGTSDPKSPGGRNGILHHYKVENLFDFSYFDSSDGKSVIANFDPSNSKGNPSFVDYKSTFTKSGKEVSHSTQLYQDYVASREYALYSGDAVYIKAGENDILIDAGAKKGSAIAIENYLDDATRGGDYVQDGTLEYVFSTHGHQDHIAGMMGTSDPKSPGGRNGILHHYKVENLFDFSYFDSSDGKSVIANFDPSNSKGNPSFVDYKSTFTKSGKEVSHSTQLYQDYVASREYALSQGTVWKTAYDVVSEFGEKAYTIELGKNLSATLLYSYFYDHTSAEVSGLESSYKRSSFSDQNDYSLSLLFTQGRRHFLFTGDSEEYAEHSLVKYNQIPAVDLFKAGHHGSYTASGDELLSKAKPACCVVTCCAGNQEYASKKENSFPAQAFLDRIAAYTDRVYVTTLGDWEDKSKHSPFNGTVVASYSPLSEETLSFSASPAKLKDSEWMKQNRTMPGPWKS